MQCNRILNAGTSISRHKLLQFNFKSASMQVFILNQVFVPARKHLTVRNVTRALEYMNRYCQMGLRAVHNRS